LLRHSKRFLYTFVEAELHQLGHVKQHQLENQYFTNIAGRGTIQDDHIPFLQRGISKNVAHCWKNLIHIARIT